MFSCLQDPNSLATTEDRTVCVFMQASVEQSTVSTSGRHNPGTMLPHFRKMQISLVADFLGHDIRVNRDFYRLPVPTTQMAKISKLLLSMEKGHLSGLQGKSVDEIEIEGAYRN